MSEEDFKLGVPFFNDEPVFALGVEAGMIFEKLKRGEAFEQSFHAENKAQIELFCIDAKANYSIEPLADGWLELIVKEPTFKNN